MQKLREKSLSARVIELFPVNLALEIERIAMSRRNGLNGIREITLRRLGLSEINISGEMIKLCARVDVEMVDQIMQNLMSGALYAHRDSIASGYISLGNGVRVGVCGSAGYEGGKMVGVSGISSLNFRIPTGECAFSEELYSVFCEGIGSGMLIYSPPGVGKTTALRSLARSIGGGKNPKRVAVVDERWEFLPENFCECRVDILRGYKRREGIEIATRTMSAELIMIDEIGADDAASIVDVITCGVPIIATAHASSFEEIRRKKSLDALFSCEAFDVFLGILREKNQYKLRVDKL